MIITKIIKNKKIEILAYNIKETKIIEDWSEKYFSEEIKKIRVDGTEYWNARELKVIDRAKLACNNSGFEIQDHFPDVREMVEIGSNTA